MGKVRNFCCDIETYSDVDLSKCGVYKYVEGDFHILLFAYAFDDEDVKIVDLACGEELPQEVLDAIDDPDVIKWACGLHKILYRSQCKTTRDKGMRSG